MWSQSGTPATPSFKLGGNQGLSTNVGSLFGGVAPSPGQTPVTSTFGSSPFGAANSTATTNLFAAPAATSASPFGAPASSAPSFGAPASSASPFGAPASSASPFGVPASSAPSFGVPASSASSFGVPASSASSFGAPAPSLFGAPAPSLFGTPAPSLFGNANPSMPPFNQQQQQQQGAIQTPARNVWQEFALVKAKWDPTSPLCQFRHYFYNLVPTNEVHLYGRPSDQSEQLWNEAQSKNPDPTCMVPVLAVGFNDVLKRMETQDKQAQLHKEKLDELSERFTVVQRKHTLDTMVKLEEHKRRHVDLSQRLIRLLRYIQVIRYKGFPLSNDEDQLAKHLDEMGTLPHSPDKLHVKMLALWTQLQSIKRERESQFNGATEMWRAINDEDTTKIEKVLEDEQKGLKHIMHVLRKDMEDLETIEAGLRVNGKGKKAADLPISAMQCT